MTRTTVSVVAIAWLGATVVLAQSPPPRFEVVSIRRNTSESVAGMGTRTLPDGTFVMTNLAMEAIIRRVSPVPVRTVIGLPDWATYDRYDIIAKPPSGATDEQRTEMLKTLFADRMKLAAHVEQREQTTFALMLARSDGRLGPQLKPSTLDCAPLAPGAPPRREPTSASEVANSCAMLTTTNSIVSGSLTIDRLARALGGEAGGLVTDRTGLQGAFALTLRYAPRRGASGAVPDDLPELFTALQEQLGLKLQPEKSMQPVFVVDHIERPTEN